MTSPSLAELQRTRLIAAMGEVAGARGYAAASLTAVTSRAGLSRQTFYAHFPNREDCFLAVLDDAYKQAEDVIFRAFEPWADWREGIREALASLLILFDTRPHIARVWILESIVAGPWALGYRERKLADLTGAILDRWAPPRPVGNHPMAPIMAMAGIIGVIQRHLATGSSEPLITLLGPLMGIATDPFLDAEGVRDEIRNAEGLVNDISSGARRPAGALAASALEIPSPLLHPKAWRARECLQYLSAHPGASNRQTARAIGISSAAQISTLLSRFVDLGLATRGQTCPGLPNAWYLTELGRVAATTLSAKG